MFISHLWNAKFDWDTPLPQKECDAWKAIVQDLERVPEIVHPRWYQLDNECPVQLHGFCDSSLSAMGTVCFLRQDSHVVLLGSKSKLVGPKVKPTVPQLELSAMVMNARYMTNVAKALRPDYPQLELYYWTDSEIGLHWLASDKPLKRTTANKVSAIKELSRVQNWRHVAGNENPADLLSRGCGTDTLKSSELWNRGPQWLTAQKDWDLWKPERSCEMSAAVAAEEIVPPVSHEMRNISKVIDLKRYSDIEHLLRVTVYVMRFGGLSAVRDEDISVGEIEKAEMLWVQSVQAEYFPESLAYLECKRDGKSVGTCPNIVRQLNLVLDENGLLRGAGRLGIRRKMPILLPRKCHFTKLVIWRAHEQVFHSGLGATVVAVRRTYWIPSTRAEVVLRPCVICKVITGRAFALPQSPDLPDFRTDSSKPFKNVGIDFTGHLFVKDAGKLRKVYVCLFTCLGTRAVNLEIVSDMTAVAFIQAFRRHCSVYSIPAMCLSDNAKTFKTASEEILNLLKIVASRPVQQHFTQNRVKFRNIPVQSPWWGGSWERLIGVMKTTIKKTLGRALISSEELYTLIKEIQAVVNDRPLTYASGDLNDPEPLTPSKLLLGHDVRAVPQYEIDEDSSESFGDLNAIRRAEKRRSVLYHHFQNRFVDEYLNALRERHSYQTKSHSPTESKIAIGDVVQIYDKDRPRTLWKLGVVTELLLGPDGLARAAVLKTSGGGRTSRAVSRLFPLEVACDDIKHVCPEKQPQSSPPVLRRSQRIREQQMKSNSE